MKIIDLNLKFMSNMRYGNKPHKIILHHAASSNCSIKDVHYWHLKKGWAGCGYHFFIRKDGAIYKGRDENAVGAHCRGHNTGSIGVCVEGNYMIDKMPEIQKKAVGEVCKYLMGKYLIKQIYSHRDFAKTDCPGNNFPFEEIKKGGYDSVTKNLYPGYLIKKNSHKYDENVVKLQKQLIRLGYDIGICGIDGYFGKNTERAVREFQKDRKIGVDGVVGSISWGRIFKQ
ncbi:N-acetylmuramoyl-L-alanine amidase [Clostridium sediminicola]|uniref:peptidoglycan recognition protein family protein n=1 Tax=Clostridium sediminicola TaxID=3114879 RepID=UPI0031F23B9F